METLEFDLQKRYDGFRLMNCVNNGPACRRGATTQNRSNLATYQAARIPYARNHDAAFYATYGGEHTVDISAVFPDFHADPYDASSYDFAVTDEYVLTTLDAGTTTFYRLGQKIEHAIKKYHIYPPADSKKWAVVCEHVIRHFTGDFADGLNLDMPYWEIWNEPDLDGMRTWGGTEEEFFVFYETAAKHLKSCFPQLKIGGPALAHKEDWAGRFMDYMQAHEVPMDFFSWHIYAHEPEALAKRSLWVRSLLDGHGYTQTESVCNEWNYIKGWSGDDFVNSIRTMIGLKGAAFTLSSMIACQKSDALDMLMYYDARPSLYNGLFDYYTLAPLKGYYPFLWYGMFYDCAYEVRSKADPAGLYSLCGVNEQDKLLCVVTHFSDDDSAPAQTVSFDFGRPGSYEIYLLDETHDGTLVETTDTPQVTLPLHASCLIKEI